MVTALVDCVLDLYLAQQRQLTVEIISIHLMVRSLHHLQDLEHPQEQSERSRMSIQGLSIGFHPGSVSNSMTTDL